jgi:hypothetical protein
MCILMPVWVCMVMQSVFLEQGTHDLGSKNIVNHAHGKDS